MAISTIQHEVDAGSRAARDKDDELPLWAALFGGRWMGI